MPQPIDMQTELSRSLIAERIQDAAVRSSMIAQQRVQAEQKKTQALKETQVDETPEAQSEHIDEDGRRKNPYVSRRPKRKPKGNASVTSRAREHASSEDDDRNLDVSI